MATQQVLIAETVAAMKKALKRKAYESDSDDTNDRYGNRGHKLQKRARFSRQGQLQPSSGPEVYKEAIEYAGVRREIISHNPPLVDDEGYEIETDDDEERVQDAIADAAALNPYANIRLENILAPLTAVTDLPAHPTLSRAFTSKTLTELAEQGSALTRKENTSLWRVKHLMIRLCGDYTWVPCGMMLGPNDLSLYSDDYVLRSLLQSGKTSATAGELERASPATLNGDSRSEPIPESTNGETGTAGASQNAPGEPDNERADVAMTDPGANDAEPLESTKGEEEIRNKTESARSSRPQTDGQDEAQETSARNGDGSVKVIKNGVDGSEPHNELSPKTTAKDNTMDGVADDDNLENSADQGLSQVTGGEVGTLERNGLQAPSSASDGVDELFIHPFFLPPAGARPDRDVGLPEPEAEDIRRLLALYVQKQEEVCRGAKRLYEGLLKADRLRKTVLRWSKAEAHCGVNRDMSDGEDWYDKEEWGLAEDLKKGQDEEEEDTGATAKKTRNRR